MSSPNLDRNAEAEEMDLDQYISAFGKEYAKKSAREKSRSNISGNSRSPDQVSAISHDRVDHNENINMKNLNTKSSVSPSNYSQQKSEQMNRYNNHGSKLGISAYKEASAGRHKDANGIPEVIYDEGISNFNSM